MTAFDYSPAPLRRQHYNATVLSVRNVTDGLMILRVVYDADKPHIEPGQYVVLGLGNWELRVDRIAAVDPDRAPKLVQRAYSVSCPLYEGGRVVGANDERYLEFCIRYVDRHSDIPPMLTPRLFCLNPGDRLFVGEKPHGSYTLGPVSESDTVVLLATGTGEAPHTTMIAELLSRGHRGRILCATTTRYKNDLAYEDAHRRLEQRFSSYRYVALTTREPWNTDSDHPEYAGKWHLQDWIASEAFRSEFGPLNPDNMHVYLCGSPAMIGLPKHDSTGHLLFPERIGVVEVLTDAGFRLDKPRHSGNIHVEKYW